jgi:hypothetical protein
MATDVINTQQLSEGALSFFGSAGDTILWVLLIGLVIAIIWMLWYVMSFKHKVVIREVAKDGKTIVKFDKAKSFKDKIGVTWWKLFRYRVKLPEPMSDSIDITAKGKKVVEFFKTEDGMFIPASVGFDYDDFKEQTGFKPLPSSQRQMIIHEFRESEGYKKKSMTDLLRDAVPYMALIMLIVALLIFMPDIIESKAEVVSAYGGVADRLYDVSDRLAEAGCTGSGGSPVVIEPPN